VQVRCKDEKEQRAATRRSWPLSVKAAHMDGSLTGFVEGRELGQLSEGAGAEWSGRRYVIRSSQPLGTGAGSCVYEAVDRRDGSTVAVKVIDRLEIDCEPSRVTQLEREINIWNKLQHPNIINLLDVVFEDSWVLLVIEYAGGGSLYSVVAAGPVPKERARVLFQQMLAAVEYCNKAGIFHRDLKLENVVLSQADRRGEVGPEDDDLATATVKLTDFGASKDSHVQSAPKTKVGTIAYMAPEVVDVTKVGTAKTYVLYSLVYQPQPLIPPLASGTAARRTSGGWG
jgi:serine/threonine protein kinase